MEDFLSINNFTHLYKTVKEYSIDRYNKKIDYKKYKKIIGNSMEEIHKNFNRKISKTKANNMVLHIAKKLIDKNMEKTFFESESNEQALNNLKHITPVVDGGRLADDDLKIRPVYEKRFNKILENNNVNNRLINNDLIIKKEYNEDIQDYFIMKRDKEQISALDLEKNPRQYREELIISPDDYIKSLNKHIKFFDVIIDSRDRNTDKYTEPNEYVLDLEREMYNIISLELISAEIPNSEYIINSDNNLLHFEESNGTSIISTIPIGNYTLATLAAAIQTQMNNDGGSTYTVTTNDFARITEVFTENNSRITSTASDPFKLFDSDLDTFWLSSSVPASFTYDFLTSQTINKYKFICTETNGRPFSWVVEVSNDNSTWVAIDTQTSVATTQNVYATFTLASNSFAGRYVRFRITASTAVDVHISEIEYFKTAVNRVTITSDLTGGSGLFNLDFFGRNVNTGHLGNSTEALYKENSIGDLLGFNPEKLTGFTNYTSENEVILSRERQVYLQIQGIDNIHTIEQHESDRFVLLTLDSNKGDVSFIKNFENNKSYEDNIDNEFVYFSDTPINMKKLNIKFRKPNGNLYNFYGLNHSLHLRIKAFNFKNQVIQGNKTF